MRGVGGARFSRHKPALHSRLTTDQGHHGLAVAGQEDVLPLNVNGELFEGAWWRPADVPTFKVIKAVVASAPDLAQVRPVLYPATTEWLVDSAMAGGIMYRIAG